MNQDTLYYLDNKPVTKVQYYTEVKQLPEKCECNCSSGLIIFLLIIIIIFK